MTHKASIQKYNMASKLKDVAELYKVLKNWRDENPTIFRLDGHHSIGPANPAQLIFFEIEKFRSPDFSGLEFDKKVDGQNWNGTYYLTASTRGSAVDRFLKLYEKAHSPSKIFKLTYTNGKESIPSKRRILLKDTTDELNAGWFCKQYYKKY